MNGVFKFCKGMYENYVSSKRIFKTSYTKSRNINIAGEKSYFTKDAQYEAC